MLTLELITIGHVIVEKIYLNDGEVIGPVLGSPAAYSSVAATLLGTRTGISTIIGKDMPYYIIEPIIKAGVNIEGLLIKGENSKSTKLVYDKLGNKKIFYEKKAPSISFKDLPKSYLNSNAFYVCPMDFEVTLDAIKKLKKLKKLMMADLGGIGGTVSTIHPTDKNKKVEKIFKSIISNFDIVKTSAEDCMFLFKTSNDFKKIFNTIHALGSKIVILTIGSKGSLISNEKEIIKIPAIKEKIKIDTTGAGDVYGAAFLSEYLRTKDLYKSGLFASTASTILIEKTGGVSILRMPTEKMVRQRMKDLK